MRLRLPVAAASIGFVLLIMVGIAAQAAEVKVLSAGVMRPVLNSLAGEFERTTRHKLVISYAPAGAVRSRIQDGETADVTILPRPAIDELVKQGKIAAGSTVNLFYSAVGVAVRAGALKPDISSVEALKRTLLAAKSIAYSDPAAGGSSGIHFARVLERLGIVEEMKSKSKLVQSPTAEFAAKGEVELAIQQVNELLAIPGIEVVGPLPPELQNQTAFTFAAGILPGAAEPEAGRALIKFLTSPAAASVIRAKWLEPASP
jgi:molybdate transport system substrate-binding protein